MKTETLLLVGLGVVGVGAVYFFTRPKKEPGINYGGAKLTSSGTAQAPDFFGWGAQRYLPQFKAGSTGADYAALASSGVNAFTRLAGLYMNRQKGVPTVGGKGVTASDPVQRTPTADDIGSGIPVEMEEPVTSVDLDTETSEWDV